MALLRRGSSRISEENFEQRRQREKAKDGALAVSLAWNDPSDLDLHAEVFLAKGGKGHIFYGNKQDAGGYLDVDMHAHDEHEVPEPVENIFWKKPPAGVYSITVKLYRKRPVGTPGQVRFRALLKREDEEDISREGAVGENCDIRRDVEVFRFTVDDEGECTMGVIGSPLPTPKPAPKSKAMRRPAAAGVMKAMKAMKVMKAMKKPMKKVMKKVMKVSKSTVAKGKKAKVMVWKGSKGKVKTKSGLKKEDLVKSKSRKIVSAKKSKQGKESKWAKATAKARAIKGYTGFKAIKKGSSFYEKAKEVMADL